MQTRLAFASFVAALVSGCVLPGLDLFGPADDAECRFDNDCANDEECRRGACVALDDGSEGEGEGEGEGDPPPDPEGPRYLQLSTNLTTMGPYDSLIITAVLTDPDGVDDIIGGSLVDPDNGASYGAFQTSASEGSYQLTVGWSALNTVRDIDFATSGTRRLQSRFFDVAGHEAAQSVAITLTCSGGPACGGACGAARCGDGSCTSSDGYPDAHQLGICAGVCRDLATNSDCGGCDTACGGDCALRDGEYPICTCGAGDCDAGYGCVDQQCQTATDLRLSPLSADTPSDGLAYMSIGGGSSVLCGFSESEANMFCRAIGYTTGGLSALPSYSGYGYQVDCAGASLFLDCVFTYDDTCDTGRVVRCGAGDPPPPPDGDFTCTTTDLGAFTGSRTGTTVAQGSDWASCVGSGPDVMYRWRAPSTGSYQFDTIGSALDTVLQVLDGGCTGASLGCDDEGGANNDSLVTASVVAGRDYVIVVDSYYAEGGTFTLNVTAR